MQGSSTAITLCRSPGSVSLTIGCSSSSVRCAPFMSQWCSWSSHTRSPYSYSRKRLDSSWSIPKAKRFEGNWRRDTKNNRRKPDEMSIKGKVLSSACRECVCGWGKVLILDTFLHIILSSFFNGALDKASSNPRRMLNEKVIQLEARRLLKTIQPSPLSHPALANML